jgi:hypothetical protein
MKKFVLKTIFNFDDEYDVSYIKITHKFNEDSEFLEKLQNANDTLLLYHDVCGYEDEDGNEFEYDEEKDLFGNCGHHIGTLLDYMSEELGIDFEYEIEQELTIVSLDNITRDNYDYELVLW